MVRVDIFETASPRSPSRTVNINITNAGNHNKANRSTVLEELDIKQTQNLPAVDVTTTTITGSLARRLEQFHIGDGGPDKEFLRESKRKPLPPRGGLQKRPAIEIDTFLPPPPDTSPKTSRDQTVSEPRVLETSTKNSGNPTAASRAFAQEQFRKHGAGQFDYVLSLPASSPAAEKFRRESGSVVCSEATGSSPTDRSDKVYFGCNLIQVQIGTQPRGPVSDDKASSPSYTLLATPIKGRDQIATSTATRADRQAPMAMDLPAKNMTPLTEAPGQAIPTVTMNQGGGSSARASPRIEDSLEALDQLDDEVEALGLDALDRAVRVESVILSDKADERVANKQTTLKRTTSTTKRPAARTGTVRAPATELSRRNSGRRSSAMAIIGQAQKPSDSPSSKRVVPMPASLREPKPPSKSTKPPTKSTFKLPGEDVARKLKEQRDARLARANAENGAQAEKPQKAALQRAASARLPTRPTFELPGEAISRRKREEHQARLQAQQEEERKRREFKARPVRASLAAPSTVPRETIASRARQSAKASAGDGADGKRRLTAGTGASPGRRPLSMLSEVSSSLQSPRGRGLTVTSSVLFGDEVATDAKAAQGSRATSTSTSGGGGASPSSGSVVTAEDVQQQRRRGREIYQRDNNASEQRELELNRRGNRAKEAREKAAKQSRDWTLTQRAKRGSMVPSAGDPIVPGDVAVGAAS